MTEHRFTFTPDLDPVVHPSGEVVYLRTGLTMVSCTCGSRFTIPPQGEPQPVLPARATLFAVQRACT